MIRLEAGLTVEAVLAGLAGGSYTVTDANGAALSSGALVGTGAVVTGTAAGETVRCTVVVCGDVNGDGYIDAADALLCLRASVGLITLTPEQEAAADVNHDGLIDAGDAILILRYDARLIPSLN